MAPFAIIAVDSPFALSSFISDESTQFSVPLFLLPLLSDSHKQQAVGDEGHRENRHQTQNSFWRKKIATRAQRYGFGMRKYALDMCDDDDRRIYSTPTPRLY